MSTTIVSNWVSSEYDDVALRVKGDAVVILLEQSAFATSSRIHILYSGVVKVVMHVPFGTSSVAHELPASYKSTDQ